MDDIVRNAAEEIPSKKGLLNGSVKSRIAEKDVAASITAKENELYHGTRRMERMMLDYIQAGDIEGIRRFFHTVTGQETINAGIVADDPLRQEKNIFIGLVALIGKTAGIDGGMDVEDSYRLIDIYTRECEKAATVDEVHVLRYSMVMDFTERVRRCRMPQELSGSTAKAIRFIHDHIYGYISLDEIAANVGISRSALTRRFRQEMKQSIGEYVTGEKIKEAQRLLLYSDLSISQIAQYLSFSGQAYFHTVFKKQTGYTPMQWQRRFSKE